jgi:hypothetical protein
MSGRVSAPTEYFRWRNCPRRASGARRTWFAVRRFGRRIRSANARRKPLPRGGRSQRCRRVESLAFAREAGFGLYGKSEVPRERIPAMCRRVRSPYRLMMLWISRISGRPECSNATSARRGMTR